jgi:TetR/AcrR family transcriptional repressor of nem operon
MPRRGVTDETRQRLLERGVEVLAQRGYHGTGLKELLDTVGVPKGSFYNYFNSKEQFGAAVIEHFVEQVAARMDAAFEEVDVDALATLRVFFAKELSLHQVAGLRGCLLGNLGAELGCSQELCRQALANGLQGMKDRFTRVLSRGQEQGRVRTDITAGDLADFLVDGYEGAQLRMQVEGSIEPLRRFTALVVEGFLPK